MATLQYECGCFQVPCCGCSAVQKGDRMCDGSRRDYPNKVKTVLDGCQSAADLEAQYPGWLVSFTQDGWVIWKPK